MSRRAIHPIETTSVGLNLGVVVFEIGKHRKHCLFVAEDLEWYRWLDDGQNHQQMAENGPLQLQGPWPVSQFDLDCCCYYR
jgi:hypothetical protein